MTRSVQEREEHEAFKNRLVDDVLGRETGDKVPMEKVVLLIWSFRDDPSVATFMARFVSKFAGSRHVFDGIEFYLPQLAHMIIHLEVEWDDAILERFALVIAQQSLHFALQLNWILQGALQDYQPHKLVVDEEAQAAANTDAVRNGSSHGNIKSNVTCLPNPDYNPTFYTRCVKLLQNIERCVVYGRPRSQELQRLYEKGQISKKELVQLEHADRRFNAWQITTADDNDEVKYKAVKLDGWLCIKLPGSTAWHTRFCELQRHILNCYRSGSCSSKLKLDRALSIERAKVTNYKNKEIRIKSEYYTFTIALSKPEDHTLWLRRLTEEADTSNLFISKRLRSDMTKPQTERYDFFNNERRFVDSLTQLAEDLRFKNRDERKQLAPQLVEILDSEIRGTEQRVYLPLCNSSDLWRRVIRALPKETRVFNTKERCPVVMQFITQRGESRGSGVKQQLDPNLDVAEYMHHSLEIHSVMEEVKEDLEYENDVGEDTNQVEIISEEALGSSAKSDIIVASSNNNRDSIEPKEYDKLNGSEHGASSVSVSNVWMEEEEEPTPSGKKGNRRVQRLMKESVALPNLLAKRIHERRQSNNRNFSVVDRQTNLQPLVPILEGNRQSMELAASRDDTDNGSVGDITVLSVERSSVLVKDTIVLADLGDGEISLESINRAKKFVCGGESWAEKTRRMLEGAREGLNGHQDEFMQLEVVSCLAKSNDDLRQEVFVMQMIHYYKSVFAQAKLEMWLKTYRILSTDSSTGLLELLTDATSIDALKKSEGFPVEGGLRKYFELVYGDPKGNDFKAAQRNFTQSLAAYSLVSYLLGLKDRHNGNIMIDTRGHLIFIDFGFAMGMAPGHEFSFERAPFKLTKEYVEVMDGVGSPCYKEFQRLIVEGFVLARKNSQIALGLVEIMMFKSKYPCFVGKRYGNGKALTKFEKRLMLRVPESQVRAKALRLIEQSRQHFGTYLYDRFQLATNGYAM